MPSPLLALVILAVSAPLTIGSKGPRGSNDIDTEVADQIYDCILADDTPRLAQLLETHGSHYSTVSSTRGLGLPLLHTAVMNGRIEAVETLVTAGDDWNGMLGFGNGTAIG